MDTDVEMVEKPVVINSDNNNNRNGNGNEDEEVVMMDSFKANLLNKSRTNSIKSNSSAQSNGSTAPITPIEE
jgi:hypothetical protein